MTNELLNRLRARMPRVMEEAVADRRYLHMHPEVGFETENTERMVRERLTELGIELLPNKTGVIGRIAGKDHSRAVALRADMDALPMQEENEVPYCSTVPGKMHACGHDGHTAMLLSAARLLQENRAELPMDVILLFQPSEEKGPGGAIFMVEDLEALGWKDRIVKGFCDGWGAKCDIRIVHGLPVLLNDDGAVDYAERVARELFPAEKVTMGKNPMMGAEDFAYFAQAFPSSFIMIGSSNPAKGLTYLGHHPKFDFDETAMETGILLLCGLALEME